MKDIQLKPGSFSEPLENSAYKSPGKSLAKFVVSVMSSATCCVKNLVLSKTTVTQLTSRSTAVIANAPAGVITSHNASFASASSVVFTVTNSYVKTTSVILLTLNTTGLPGFGISYSVESVAAGSFAIRVLNSTGSAIVLPMILNYAVL